MSTLRVKTENNEHICPFALARAIKQHVGEIEEAKNLGAGEYKIITKNQDQTNKLLNMKHINNIKIKISEDKTDHNKKGVIKCNSLKFVGDETILDELRDQGVVEMKRILRKGKALTGEKGVLEGLCGTGSFIISFKQEEMPTLVKMGFERFQVEPYYPQPMRCHSCHSMGHSARSCKKRVCGNCGSKDENHDEKTCSEEPFCTNCKGPHPAWNKLCRTYLTEKMIIKYKIDNNLSYIEARKTHLRTAASYSEVTRKSPTQDNQPILQEIRDTHSEERDKNLMSTLEKIMETLNSQQQIIKKMLEIILRTNPTCSCASKKQPINQETDQEENPQRKSKRKEEKPEETNKTTTDQKKIGKSKLQKPFK